MARLLTFRARRLAYLAGAAGALLCCAPVGAVPPRIIGGQPASPGEYPAQGLLEFVSGGDTFVCGGSLVSNRYFLTAAHCATELDTTTPLAPGAFRVSLGKINQSDFVSTDRFTVASNDVDSQFAYVGGIPRNDAALLTLATPAPARLEPLRLIEAGETGLWAAGDAATIVGWGTTESRLLSNALLEAAVPIESDADCTGGLGLEVQRRQHGLRGRRPHRHLRRRLGRSADGQRRRLPRPRRAHLVG